MPALRIDQDGALEALRQSALNGERRVVMQAPTGFGKTVLAAALIKSARAKGKRVLFTVPAIGLIDQTVEMFYEHGITEVGVMQATHHMTDWSKPVQVASVQTLQNRTMPAADVAIIDEVHKWFTFYGNWLCDPKWAATPIIGLSATPWRKRLGNYFTGFIKASTTRELIEEGLLAPFKVYAPSHPDLSGVSTVAGDYHEGQLSAAMSQSGLVADVVQTWLRLGEGRPTLCYGVDRVHAKHLQTQFLAAGVPCGYQDAYTNDLDRKAIKRQFHNGTLKVVCNVGTLTTGIDWDVRCISMCRPTKSDMLFVQIVGRGLRTAEGKDHCLILDHSDNHARLGFVTDVDESYTGLLSEGAEPHSNRTDAIPLPKECPQCAFLKPPRTAKCPACGFVAVAVNRINPDAGELRELKPKPKAPKQEAADWSSERKATFYGELKSYGVQHAYKPGWAANKYRERMGVWPNAYRLVPLIAPSPETLNWIKSTQIRWAWANSKPRRELTGITGSTN